MESKIILESFMPKGFPLDKFELVKIEKKLNDTWSPESQKMYPYSLSYYFEEKNIRPDWYKEWELLSKWFTEYKTIPDLPLRNNFFEIKVKVRRWLIKGTNKVFSNELKVTDNWTRNTKDLSFFLN
jgi:hypothetical protein